MLQMKLQRLFLYNRTTQASPIATNDDTLEILLSTTTRDNISDYTTQIGQDHQLIRKE